MLALCPGWTQRPAFQVSGLKPSPDGQAWTPCGLEVRPPRAARRGSAASVPRFRFGSSMLPPSARLPVARWAAARERRLAWLVPRHSSSGRFGVAAASALGVKRLTDEERMDEPRLAWLALSGRRGSQRELFATIEPKRAVRQAGRLALVRPEAGDPRCRRPAARVAQP